LHSAAGCFNEPEPMTLATCAPTACGEHLAGEAMSADTWRDQMLVLTFGQ
jgi:hypothetical protein